MGVAIAQREVENSAVKPTGVVLLVRDIDAAQATWESLLGTPVSAPITLPSGARYSSFTQAHGMTVQLLMPPPEGSGHDPLQEHLSHSGEGVLALVLDAENADAVYAIAQSVGVSEAVIEIDLPDFVEYLIPGDALSSGDGTRAPFGSTIAYRVYKR